MFVFKKYKIYYASQCWWCKIKIKSWIFRIQITIVCFFCIHIKWLWYFFKNRSNERKSGVSNIRIKTYKHQIYWFITLRCHTKRHMRWTLILNKLEIKKNVQWVIKIPKKLMKYNLVQFLRLYYTLARLIFQRIRRFTSFR